MREPFPIHHNPHIRTDSTAKMAQHATQLANLRVMVTQEMEAQMEDFLEPELFFLPNISKRFEKLESKAGAKKEHESESTKTEKEEEKAVAIRRLENISERFQKQNEELQSRLLLLLRASIKSSDSKEEILTKVLNAYQDLSLADEALDFLIESSEGDLKETIRSAKKEFNERHGTDIRAGRNMGAMAREYATQELGSATALRDMYRDIVNNPREAPILFEELSKEFPYNKMKTVIEFLLHAAGADLKSKGPSISRAELHNLMSETRTMQAVLGIYRFFKSRMNLIESSFKRNQLILPHKLTFELIARLFMKFLQERYPSAEKALLLAAELGISDSLLAEIIIYTQMRDGVRQIAPKLYKSEHHKQDVLLSFISALEDLEKQLEGEETEEEEEEKEEKEEEPS